jgi:hypothetical protein
LAGIALEDSIKQEYERRLTHVHRFCRMLLTKAGYCRVRLFRNWRDWLPIRALLVVPGYPSFRGSSCLMGRTPKFTMRDLLTACISLRLRQKSSNKR